MHDSLKLTSLQIIYVIVIIFMGFAIYRVTSKNGLKILMTDDNDGSMDSTSNVVYKRNFLQCTNINSFLIVFLLLTLYWHQKHIIFYLFECFVCRQ